MPYVQQRRGTASALAALSEIPLAGQVYYETDTGKLKVGDGVQAYAALEYITDASNLIDNSIPTGKIADGAVTSDKLANLAATTAKIADGAVTSGKIADGTITAQDMATHTVDSARIAPDAVVESKILAGAVTETKIATDAVTTDKIAQFAVDTQEIAAGAVETGKLDWNSVTYAKMQHTEHAGVVLGRTGNYSGVVGTGGQLVEIALSDFARTYINQETLAGVKNVLGFAEQTDIDTAISDLVDSAPDLLNTLGELATALGENVNFSTTITQSIADNTALAGTKMPLVGGTFTGDVDMQRSASSATKIDWGNSNGGNWSSTADDLDYIRLYSSGSTYAGMGITSGNFNIGTTGLVNLTVRTDGSIRTRYTSGGEAHHFGLHKFDAPFFVSAGNTPTAPKISVDGDSHTGIYFPADNKVAVSTGGVQQIIITNQALEVFAGAIYSPLYRTNTDGTKTLTAYGRTGDNDTGMFFPAPDKVALAAGGVEFMRGATTGSSTVVSSSHLIDSSNFIYANGYRAKNNGSKTDTAYGKHNQGNTGIYFPADDEVGISAKDKDRVKFDEDRTTFYREGGKETIKADAANAGYMIIDSSGGFLSLNHYTPDHILLCYTQGGSGNVIIGASSTSVSAANPTNRKLYVHGTIQSSAETHAQRYLVNGYGSAQDPAFEIVGAVDGTGVFAPSSVVNDGNIAGHGFGISVAHTQYAEFGDKCWIGTSRPTTYSGAKAAQLELNGNNKRGALFAYTSHSAGTSASDVIGGEFNTIAQGGTTANVTKGVKSHLRQLSTDGASAMGVDAMVEIENLTGTQQLAYGLSTQLKVASSCSGTITRSASLYVSPNSLSSNATYPSDGEVPRAYAIYQDGHLDNNRYDGKSWFYADVTIKNANLELKGSGSQILLVNGTAADPAITFTSGDNNGIYKSGTNTWNLVAGGTARVTISSGNTIFTSGITANAAATFNSTVNITNGLNLSELAQSSATTGQYIKWDGSAWVPSTVTGGSGSGGSTTLAGLSDTSVSGVGLGDLLWHNGSFWQPNSFSSLFGTYGYIGDLKDVAITSPEDNAVLRYDSSEAGWVDYNPDTFETYQAWAGQKNLTVDLSDGLRIQKWELHTTGIHQFAFSNVPTASGTSCSFTLAVVYAPSTTATTSAIIQWPASVKWPGGTAPTLTNKGQKTDTFTFLSFDNGTTWLGHVGGQNF